jgi:hypothetical protein
MARASILEGGIFNASSSASRTPSQVRKPRINLSVAASTALNARRLADVSIEAWAI